LGIRAKIEPVPWRLAFPGGHGQGIHYCGITCTSGMDVVYVERACLELAGQLIEQLMELGHLALQMGQPGAWIPNFHAHTGTHHDHFSSLFDL